MFRYVAFKVDSMPASTEDSFVSRLLETVGSQTDRIELISTLRDLLHGGDETTSTALRWLFVELANNRHVQIRLQQEIDAVVGHDGLTSLDDESRMPYTQATILEAFRCHTLLPVGVFHRTTSDTQIFDWFVPADTTVNTKKSV